MGREIRRVPRGWQHPRKPDGRYQPLFDETYAEAAEEWCRNFEAWRAGTHERWADRHEDYPYYWDWDSKPPNEDYYRPAFAGEPTCYQIYETVSEGTPVSPVFETLDELEVWLINQGYSETASRKFRETGHSFSMIVRKTEDGFKIAENIHGLDLYP